MTINKETGINFSFCLNRTVFSTYLNSMKIEEDGKVYENPKKLSVLFNWFFPEKIKKLAKKINKTPEASSCGFAKIVDPARFW